MKKQEQEQRELKQEGGAGKTLCIISGLPLSSTQPENNDDFVTHDGGYAVEITSEHLLSTNSAR